MAAGAARSLTAPRSRWRKACLAVLVATLCGGPNAGAADPLIAAAGDIACSPSSQYFRKGAGTSTRCRQRHTSDLLVNAGLAAVLALGDNQYDTGRLSSFRGSYDPSWGRLKPITRPVAGNHEYKRSGAAGYFDYFNGEDAFTGLAGDRDKGYYSFDVGAWHLIALNSSDHCSDVSCASGSPQERWLRADLASHPSSCALAYWHHPRFNSGHDGNATFMQPIFEDLYEAGVDVVLGGHAHHYERFALQDPGGRPDPAAGIRQFVVGTGGAFFTSVGTARPNSQVRRANGYGVLFMTLHATSYEWGFVSDSGRLNDSGTQRCNGLLPAVPSVAAVVPGSTPPSFAPGGAAERFACDLRGTPGDDVLTGTARGETICGLGGDDLIRGGAGADVIRGGAGRDRIFGGAGDDRIQGGMGNDRIHGEAGRDHVRGNDGRDRIYGGGGRDTAFGGTGDDRLQGGFGGDTLSGQSGNDRIAGGRGPNRLYGNAGNDVLIADRNHRRDRLNGGKGRDVARADPGDRVRSARRRR